MERGGRVSPSTARMADGGDDNATVLGVQFDVADQARLFEEGLGNANPLRIADGNDAGFDCRTTSHGTYNVCTDARAVNDRRADETTRTERSTTGTERARAVLTLAMDVRFTAPTPNGGSPSAAG